MAKTHTKINYWALDVPMGAFGGALHLPIRELVTVFSVTFCSLSRVGQLVKMHRNRKSLRTSLIGPLDLCDGNIIGL